MNGISPLSTTGQNLILTHPSKTDHKRSREVREKHIINCQERLATWESKLQEVEMKIQMGIKPEGYDKSYRKNVESLVSQIDKTRQLLRSCETFFQNRSDFGHVFAASGFRRSSENNQLDWALIMPIRPANTDVSLCWPLRHYLQRLAN